MNLSTYPVLFKIGYARGKALGFIIPMIMVSFAVGVFVTLWNTNEGFNRWVLVVIEWSCTHVVSAGVILLGLSGLVMAVSYTLSQMVYARREF
jgi:hypothetical protein